MSEKDVSGCLSVSLCPCRLFALAHSDEASLEQLQEFLCLHNNHDLLSGCGAPEARLGPRLVSSAAFTLQLNGSRVDPETQPSHSHTGVRLNLTNVTTHPKNSEVEEQRCLFDGNKT